MFAGPHGAATVRESDPEPQILVLDAGICGAVGQLFVQGVYKNPNSLLIGEGTMGPGSGPGAGASANPPDGDFDFDAILYKIAGGTLLDPKMAVASNGSSS